MLSVIIPAFNESENIKRFEKELIPSLEKLGVEYEAIIVNDGSVDDTDENVRILKKKFKSIRLVNHLKNLGLGAAIRTGVKEAVGQQIVFLDADLTFHPKQICLLLDAYNKTRAQCIIGSPFVSHGKAEGVSFFRLILTRGVNLLYALLLGKRIRSFSSIFRLYESKPLKKIKIESNDFVANAEILMELIKNNAKIVEIPVVLTCRTRGRSKINVFREFKNHVKLLCKIFFWRLQNVHCTSSAHDKDKHLQ